MKNDAIAALFALGHFVSPKALADLGLLDDGSARKEPAPAPVSLRDRAARPQASLATGNCATC